MIIVFDFDGTLIDSREVKADNYVEAFRRVFEAGPEQIPMVRVSVEHTAGANRFIQLDDTLKRTGLKATKEQKLQWSNLYSALNSDALKQVKEFGSVRNVLERLAQSGHRLFATSGILPEEFLREMNRRNLAGYFLEMRGGDKTGYLTELKDSSEQTLIFVGDTSYDKKTASQVGVEFYHVVCNNDLARLPDHIQSIVQ